MVESVYSDQSQAVNIEMKEAFITDIFLHMVPTSAHGPTKGFAFFCIGVLDMAVHM